MSKKVDTIQYYELHVKKCFKFFVGNFISSDCFKRKRISGARLKIPDKPRNRGICKLTQYCIMWISCKDMVVEKQIGQKDSLLNLVIFLVMPK